MSEFSHIVCPHCEAVNRIPAARLGEGPKCGQCHQPLFDAHPVELTAASFLYADADALFVHAHRRQQPDGSNIPPGLHLLHRSCKKTHADLTGRGIKVSQLQQEVILVASVPLTDEPWLPLAEGEIIVLAGGKVLTRRLVSGS